MTRFGTWSCRLLAVASLAFWAPSVRAGDDPEPACNDADVENLNAELHCNGNQWQLTGDYDVEIESPASGAQFDLILTLVDCNAIPSKGCGQLAKLTVPLDNQSILDSDDNDEIEFEGNFSTAVCGDMAVNCKRLRIHAEVVERCGGALLDEEEDKVVVAETGSCGPECPVVTACDECPETTAVVTNVSYRSDCGLCD